MAIRALINR